MQPIEKQIELLATKVDGIYQILDRLHQHILPPDDPQREKTTIKPPRPVKPQLEVSESPAWLIHQDVILDGDHILSSSYDRSEPLVTPHSQIQRLTAQLTVAYNRIAALEEQLLAKQRHS
jgi:hypothetical protein